MGTEIYARHTMTLIADHRDGQRREYLGGNPFGATGREKDSRQEKDGRADGERQRQFRAKSEK